MNRIKFVLLAAISIAMVFTSCGEVDTDDGGGSSGSSSSRRGGSSGSTAVIDPDIPCAQEVDPFTQFCLGGEVYERCGNEEYDPSTRFCFENKFYLKCNGMEYPEYDPLIQFCSGGELYLRCNGKERDPGNEFCFENKKVVPKCDGENFNPDEQFCFGRTHLELADTLISKCDGNEYLPSEQFCKKSKLYTICEGDSKYDISRIDCCGGEKMQLATEFCFEQEKKIYDKCGDSTYHPTYEFCYEDEQEVYSLCGGERFDPATEFCSQNKFYLKCGGSEYDPVQQICIRNQDGIEENAYLRCGGKPADPDYEFCFDNKIYTKCVNKTKIYNPFEQFCFQAKDSPKDSIYDMCGDLPYDPGKQTCHRLKIHELCDGEMYDFEKEYCFDGSLYKAGDECRRKEAAFCDISSVTDVQYNICNNKKYDLEKKFCYDDSETYDLCGGAPYDPVTEFCAPVAGKERKHTKCNVKSGPDDFGKFTYTLTEFDPEAEACVANDIVGSKSPQTCMISNGKYEGKYSTDDYFCCFGQVYPKNGDYFCYENELYTRCGRSYKSDGAYSKGAYTKGDTAYIPRDSLCYKGTTLKPNCSKDGVRGPCVHSNGLLRCKQLGDGSDYIIDPLPGMEQSVLPGFKCEDNGAITGEITDYRKGASIRYNIAQIGSQIWLAENVKLDAISDDDAIKTYDTTYKKNYTVDTTVYDPVDTTVYDTVVTKTTTKENNIESVKEEAVKKIETDGVGKPFYMENGVKKEVIFVDGPYSYTNNDNGVKEITIQYGRSSRVVTKSVPRTYPITKQKDTTEELTRKETIEIQIGNCYNGTCGKYGRLYKLFGPFEPKNPAHSQINGYDSKYFGPIEISSSICPQGFRIPSSGDWQKLAEYAGGVKKAGGRLKSQSWNGGDDYGFNALPGGYGVYWERSSTPYTYHEQGDRSFWWTSSQIGNETYYFDMISSDSELRTHYRSRDGYSYVRCVREAAF